MPTVVAPERMTRREMVTELLSTVTSDVPGVSVLTVSFEVGEHFPTTSFIDELVRQVLANRLANTMVFAGADNFTSELARAAAKRHGVSDRLVVTPQL